MCMEALWIIQSLMSFTWYLAVWLNSNVFLALIILITFFLDWFTSSFMKPITNPEVRGSRVKAGKFEICDRQYLHGGTTGAKGWVSQIWKSPIRYLPTKRYTCSMVARCKSKHYHKRPTSPGSYGDRCWVSPIFPCIPSQWTHSSSSWNCSVCLFGLVHWIMKLNK